MPRDRQDLRRRLSAVAREQSGYFTAAQAKEIGYSYPAQTYHANRHNWERVGRGIYRFPEWPVGRHDDLVRWHLWSRGRGVVSHESALSVHELGDVNPARFHLTVPTGFHQKAPSVVLHVADLPGDDVRSQEGFKLTTPLRSLLDVAAGDLDADQLRRAIRDALELGIVSRRGLLMRADEFGPKAALRIERAVAGGDE